MVVICKRFSMDDVPVKLVNGTMKDGLKVACRMAKRLTGDKVWATKRDQKIAGSDIGTECCALLVVAFNAKGNVVSSDSVSVG